MRERARRPELHRRPAHRQRLERAGDGGEVDPVAEELEREVPLRPRRAASRRGNLDRRRGGVDGVEDVIGRDHGHEAPAQLGLAHPIETSFMRSRLSNEIVANWRTISRSTRQLRADRLDRPVAEGEPEEHRAGGLSLLLVGARHACHSETDVGAEDAPRARRHLRRALARSPPTRRSRRAPIA